ncbi:expressed unknown protein [Ectocarpus siliculosus]|uniref:Uncharacterized protein n=1 Tax=Ectocarpus siliculosus TaxID=2880 RepID=D7FWT8_ECTSI|nr:expressed unknown protein [Ectocarpus siliculosus]|eukprot:CBJ32176.1 expressed unknown protein [Ectocarpus siliculosus]
MAVETPHNQPRLDKKGIIVGGGGGAQQHPRRQTIDTHDFDLSLVLPSRRKLFVAAFRRASLSDAVFPIECGGIDAHPHFV